LSESKNVSASFRAALVDAEGRIVGIATRATAVGAEFDPTRWWRAFCEAAGLDYVSASPYRVPIARLAAAQAALRGK